MLNTWGDMTMGFENVNVLIVDDEECVLDCCEEILRTVGFKPTAVQDPKRAIQIIQESKFEVAVVDLCMPDTNGLELIRQFKKVSPETKFIILTGYPSLETSIEAIQECVFAYLRKPESMDHLVQTVRSATYQYQLEHENRSLVRQLTEERNHLQVRVEQDESTIKKLIEGGIGFIGESESMERVRRQVTEVAGSDMTVLIRGESGTGKDVVARLLATMSENRGRSGFVKINCPAIPESLLESELFGHERGAFTGADRSKPGRFELAAGGTIFLDEIAEIPVSLQAKLLQVIEHKQFCRLGDTKTRTVNARIIAATNGPLETMIAKGLFRADLFYRLNDYRITLPPLRERKVDIPLLVTHFISKYNLSFDAKDLTISPSTMKQLTEYAWPGNVRELESIIRRFSLTGNENTIWESLSSNQIPMVPSKPFVSALPISGPPPSVSRLDEIVLAAERQAITDALEQTGWNQRHAADLLGVSYSTLRRKIETCGIRRVGLNSGFPNGQ